MVRSSFGACVSAVETLLNVENSQKSISYDRQERQLIFQGMLEALSNSVTTSVSDFAAKPAESDPLVALGSPSKTASAKSQTAQITPFGNQVQLPSPTSMDGNIQLCSGFCGFVI